MRQNGKHVYAGVLDIPEGTSGAVSIKHEIKPAGKIPLHNMRTALFGQKGGHVSYDHPTRWHNLVEEDHGLWMTDLPIEQRQHDEESKTARGHVLVGGLGLGYIVAALSARKQVKSITVVERSEDVIKLVQPHLRLFRDIPVDVVNADLFEFLKTDTRSFTWAFYDIWQFDGEITFHSVVVPLRKLSEGKVDRVVCWNEDIMRGQLLMALRSRLLYVSGDIPDAFKEKGPDIKRLTTKLPDTEQNIWVNWSVPFFRWYHVTKPSIDLANQVSEIYAMAYGTSNLNSFIRQWG